jgi:hypothetical protein
VIRINMTRWGAFELNLILQARREQLTADREYFINAQSDVYTSEERATAVSTFTDAIVRTTDLIEQITAGIALADKED